VSERQGRGVQGDETFDGCSRTIFPITDNRPALRGKLDADLMTAACLGTNFQQGEPTESFEPFIEQDAVLT
jgi:hypothetical protein